MRLIDPNHLEGNEALHEALLEASEAFLAAGGVITLGDWQTLSTDERAALTAAQKKRDITLACLHGIAAQGPDENARLFAEVDGGDTFVASALDTFVQNAVDRMKMGVSAR